MKKLAISLGVVVGVACIVGAAMPWYIGMETENFFRTQLNESLLGSNPQVTVQIAKYERGWLHATAVHRVVLKADQDVQFDIVHEIDHVPDPNSGWLKVHSTPRWPKEVQAGADYYFGNQPALTLESVLSFERQLTTKVSSPAFSKPMLKNPESKLSWGGASGTFTFPGGRRMQAKILAPNIDLSSTTESLQLTRARLDTDWVMLGKQADWHGDMNFTIGEIAATTPFGKFAFSQLKAGFSQRDLGQTVQMGYSIKIGKGESNGSGPAKVAFSNAVFEVELDKLDKNAIASYTQDMQNAQTAKDDGRTQLRLMTNMMAELLKGSPELRIKQVGVETPEGAIGGRATLSFDGKDFAQQNLPTEWFQRVSFNGSAEVSRTLLKSMLQTKIQAQVMMMPQSSTNAADPAQLTQMVDKAIEDQFKAWGAAGLVQDKGDKFVVQAEFTKGKLMLNGQPGDHLIPPMLMSPQAQSPMPAIVVPRAGDART